MITVFFVANTQTHTKFCRKQKKQIWMHCSP